MSFLGIIPIPTKLFLFPGTFTLPLDLFKEVLDDLPAEVGVGEVGYFRPSGREERGDPGEFGTVAETVVAVRVGLLEDDTLPLKGVVRLPAATLLFFALLFSLFPAETATVSLSFALARLLAVGAYSPDLGMADVGVPVCCSLIGT